MWVKNNGFHVRIVIIRHCIHLLFTNNMAIGHYNTKCYMFYTFQHKIFNIQLYFKYINVPLKVACLSEVAEVLEPPRLLK